MTDWYRNTDWNEDIEKRFFAKLERARSQRDQYLVIQAITLASSHPKVALRLVDHYFQTRTDDFHDPRARMAATSAEFALGGYVKALDGYLKTLTDPDAQSSLQVSSPLEFAFLAARFRSSTHYSSALEMLQDLSAPEQTVPDLFFRHLAARALLRSETGRDPTGAVRDAAAALQVPPPVLAAYSDIVWRLRGLTRS